MGTFVITSIVFGFFVFRWDFRENKKIKERERLKELENGKTKEDKTTQAR